jgi:hypothetical protein
MPPADFLFLPIASIPFSSNVRSYAFLAHPTER